MHSRGSASLDKLQQGREWRSRGKKRRLDEDQNRPAWAANGQGSADRRATCATASEERNALHRDLNITLERGERLALIGP